MNVPLQVPAFARNYQLTGLPAPAPVGLDELRSPAKPKKKRAAKPKAEESGPSQPARSPRKRPALSPRKSTRGAPRARLVPQRAPVAAAPPPAVVEEEDEPLVQRQERLRRGKRKAEGGLDDTGGAQGTAETLLQMREERPVEEDPELLNLLFAEVARPVPRAIVAEFNQFRIPTNTYNQHQAAIAVQHWWSRSRGPPPPAEDMRDQVVLLQQLQWAERAFNSGHTVPKALRKSLKEASSDVFGQYGLKPLGEDGTPADYRVLNMVLRPRPPTPSSSSESSDEEDDDGGDDGGDDAGVEGDDEEEPEAPGKRTELATMDPEEESPAREPEESPGQVSVPSTDRTDTPSTAPPMGSSGPARRERRRRVLALPAVIRGFQQHVRAG